MKNFRRGEKVRCVDAEFDSATSRLFAATMVKVPKKGKIYTIRSITRLPDGDAIRLKEICNPSLSYIGMKTKKEPAFKVERFESVPVEDLPSCYFLACVRHLHKGHDNADLGIVSARTLKEAKERAEHWIRQKKKKARCDGKCKTEMTEIPEMLASLFLDNRVDNINAPLRQKPDTRKNREELKKEKEQRLKEFFVAVIHRHEGTRFRLPDLGKIAAFSREHALERADLWIKEKMKEGRCARFGNDCEAQARRSVDSFKTDLRLTKGKEQAEDIEAEAFRKCRIRK